MERLTKRNQQGKVYIPKCFSRCDGMGLREECNYCDVQDTLTETLAAYEDTNLNPKRITEVDKAFYDRCQEVNRLTAELAELKKQPQGDLISRSAMIESITNHMNKPENEDVKEVYEAFIKFLAEQSTAYDVEKVVERIQRINTTWNCQECEHLNLCDGIEKCGDEHLDLCAEVVKLLSIDIVRNGGKE